MEKTNEEQLAEAFNQLNGITAVQTLEVKTEEAKTDTVVTEEPLKVELERLKSKKTPEQKARDSLYYNALEAKKLGIDIANDEKLKEALGIKQDSDNNDDDSEEEDKPVSRKEFLEFMREAKQTTVVKTAEELANDIQDQNEREITLYHIHNTIRSSGNPEEDLKLARTLTNSVKNTQILEEAARKPEAKSHSSATGGSTATAEPTVVLTAEEEAYLATGVITKEEIIAFRTK